MKKILFFIFVAVFGLLGQSNKAKDHKNYYPLTEGSKWEYKWVMGEGESYSATTIKEMVGYYEGEPAMKIEAIMENLSPLVKYNTFKIYNTGILITGIAGGIAGDKYLRYEARPQVLPLPLEIGKTWQYEDGRKMIEFKIVKWHPYVTTKYGKFNDVYEVEQKTIDGNSTSYSFQYYAYGIGLIKEETGNGHGSRSDTNVLKSYTIK